MPKKKKIKSPTIWDNIQRRSTMLPEMQKLAQSYYEELYRELERRIAEERRELQLREQEEVRKQQESQKQKEEQAKRTQKSSSTNVTSTTQQDNTTPQNNTTPQTADYELDQPFGGKFTKQELDIINSPIMPSILHPNFLDWAEHHSKQNPNDWTTLNAKNALNLSNSIKHSLENEDESNIDRINRRIIQNNTFAVISPEKRLTEDEIKEINAYRAITDPLYAKDVLDELHNRSELIRLQEEEEMKKLEGVKKPDNYFGQEKYEAAERAMQGAANSAGAQGFEFASALLGLFKSKYAKSAASDFILKTNESLMEVPAGQIARSNELLQLVPRARDYKDIIHKYAENLQEIQQLQLLQRSNSADLQRSGVLNSNVISNKLGQLIDQNRRLRQLLLDGSLWKDANNLASWSSGGIIGQIAQKIDSIIDDDLGGIRGKLFGLGGKLDKLNELMNENNHSPEWLSRVSSVSLDIENILQNFENATDKRQNNWRKQMEVDIKDMNDWKSGENWLGMHANVDDFYDAQSKILEKLQYTWSDPVRLGTYGWSGIAGGSNSSWWKSIIGMSSKAIGAIGGAITSGGTSTFIQLSALATSFEADKSAGSDENNIESANKTSDSLRRKLQSEDKYDDFIIEGAKQMGYNDDVKKLLSNTKDAETVKRYIADMFVAGMWHSVDPEVSKMHAEAVIGTNNQFYNNQIVNTGDAAIGSAVAILNLQPVKYLARASKIAGTLALRTFTNSAVGQQAALRYAGFKAGVNKIANSRVATAFGETLTKGSESVANMLAKPAAYAIKAKEGVSKGAQWIGGKVSSLSNPVVSGFNAAKLALHPIFVGVEYPIAQRMAAVRAYASIVPSAWMKASATAKTVGNIGARIGIDTVSEMTQEGVQGLMQYNGNPYLNDHVGSIAPDYDILANRPMLLRMIDDLSYANVAWLIWLHQNDPTWATDADVVASMNATPLLTLFGPNTFQVGVQAHNLIKEYRIIDMLAQQIDAERRGDIAQIEQGKFYAGHLDKESYKKMQERFDTYKKIAGTHRNAVSRYNALSRLRNGAENATMLNDGEHAIPDEIIEKQRQDYEDIYRIGNSGQAMALSVKAGINYIGRNESGELAVKRNVFDIGTKKKYKLLVSLLNHRINKRREAFEKLEETDNEINKLFGQDLFEDESWYDDETILNTSLGIINDVKALTRLAALFDILQDYSSAESENNKNHVFLLRVGAQIKEIQKNFEKKNAQLSSKEDVLQYLNDSMYGAYLQLIVSRAGTDTSDMTVDQIVDGVNQWQRERELNEFDLLIQLLLYSDFLEDPSEQMNAYQNARKSDQLLEKILEDDYLTKIKDYTEALNREVRDADPYQGDDGKWYITDIKTLSNGEERVVKHSYNPRTEEIGREDLKFDRVEYHESKKVMEKALEEKKRNRKINKNLASQPEHTENEGVEVQPDVAADEADEDDISELFKSGNKVFVKLNSGQIIPGVVKDYDLNKDEVLLEDGIVVKSDKVFEHKPFIDETGILVGDDVQYLGKTYKVIHKNIWNIDQDNLTALYSLLLQDEDGKLVIALTGEVEKIEQKDDEDDTNKKFSKTVPNRNQQEVLDQLKKFKEDTEKLVKRTPDGKKKLTTGHNYFIKVKNRFLQFIRVHGVLDDLFDKTDEQKRIYNSILTELVDLLNNKQSKLKSRIIELQNEYNLKLAEEYGEDSDVYNRYSIDLAPYITQQALRDIDTPIAVAEIVTNEVPGAAVVAGTAIDTVVRDFFKNEGNILNKPEYYMSDEVFNDLYDLLIAFNDYIVNTLHWVVDTTDYTWFGTNLNGKRVAGETDMIAIDQSGDIHIIDFKTSRSRNRFDTIIDPETDEEISPFIDEVASFNERVGNRSYGAQYAMLLEAYRLLIQQTTGRNVASLLILPIVLSYDDYSQGKSQKNNESLKEITDTKVKHLINLSSNPKLKKYITGVDNYLLGVELVDIMSEEDVEEFNELIDSILQDIQNALIDENAKGVARSVLNELRKYAAQLRELKEKIKSIDKTEEVEVKSITDELDNVKREVILLLKDADLLHNETIQHEQPETEHGAVAGWKNTPIEDIPSDENRWWHFNRLHSFSDYVRKIPKWMESIIKADFIKNSTFEITVADRDFYKKSMPALTDAEIDKLLKEESGFRVRVTYRPFGKSPIKFTTKFEDDIQLILGNNAPDDNKNNGRNPDNLLSAAGRNFIRQYSQLLATLKPGETIVAKTVTRTNGKLIYSKKDQNLTKTAFFKNWKDRIYNLLDGENSLIGVSDGVRVFEISDSNRETIFASDYYGGDNMKIRTKELPGNTLLDEDDRVVVEQNIPNGSVVFLYKFKYDEDPEDKVRTVPLVLKGRKLDRLNDARFILQTCVGHHSRLNHDATFIAKLKNGKTKEVKVSGLTNRKLLQMLVRFGGQAQNTNDEFIFNYGTKMQDGKAVPDFTSIIITDLREEPSIFLEDEFRPQIMVESEDGTSYEIQLVPELHRPVISLDLSDTADLKAAIEILQKLDMHINQVGIMRASLNDSNESGWFGLLGAFFLDDDNSDVVSIQLKDDKNIQFTREDVIPDENDNGVLLSGIGWMIKNGHAKTNAESIENPLISIVDLEKINKSDIDKPNKRQKQKETDTINPDPQELPIVVLDKPLEKIEDTDTEEKQTKPKGSKKKNVTISDVSDLINSITEDDLEHQLWFNDIWNAQSVAVLNKNRLTEYQKKKIEKAVKRLLGKYNITWHKDAVDVLQGGATVAGRAAVHALHLSERMPNGVEYHESFHIIMELLVPQKIRQKLYDEYKEKYNDTFKKNNGRDLDERDISEAFAEMFRYFLINRDHIKLFRRTNTKIPFYLPNNWFSVLDQIDQYSKSLLALGSRRFAMLFIAANSGLFRFIRPSKSNIDRFVNVLGGEMNFSISATIDGKRKRARLNHFPDFGGIDIFNDAVEVLVYALTRSCKLDALATNAYRLDTSLKSILNLYRGNEKTEHSAWFRVITGEYTKPGEKITILDALMYMQLNKTAPALLEIAQQLRDQDLSEKEYKNAFMKTVVQLLMVSNYEDCDQNQLHMRDILSEENWSIVEQKLNARLNKMGIDSQLQIENKRKENLDTQDGQETAPDEDGSSIYSDVESHDDEASYAHSRTEDASAAVRYLLSTIPDERFATEEDVKLGIVKSVYIDNKKEPELSDNKQKFKRTIANRSGVFGIPRYLGMKRVSNKLFIACREAKTAALLDAILQILAPTDPVFQRIAKIYHSYYQDEILKHEDTDKNRIKVNGKELSKDKYEQINGPEGVYYIYSDTKDRIENAETIVNRNKESFVTQLLNYVSVQKHDFIQVAIDMELDEDGDIIEGHFKPKVQSTDSDYASKIYPSLWFARFASGVSGIFEIKNGRYKFTNNGKEDFEDAVDALKQIGIGVIKKGVVTVGKEKYSIQDENDFGQIIDMFIQALNTLGIDISQEQFIYGLRKTYNADENLLSTYKCFQRFISSAGETKDKISYKAFIAMLNDLSKKLSSTGSNKILYDSHPEYEMYMGNKKAIVGASGTYLYSENAIIKWFADAVEGYNKSNSDLMQYGAGGKKQYTMAQSNTASDVTDDMNATHLDDSGTPVGSKVISDMKKYAYNYGYRITRNGKKKLISCLLLKHFSDVKAMEKNDGKASKLIMHTHGGVRMSGDYTGGVAYKKITEREDYIAKAAILLLGGILFPTLSDKSTWFYLTGCSVPGIDYKNIQSISKDSLLQLSILPGQKDGQLHVSFNTMTSNEQLDLMIEYAYLERNAIEQEINRKSWLPKIEFFEENRKRFGGLTEIVIIDKNGKTKLIPLNDADKTPEKCLEIADKYFFSPEIPMTEKRKIMALTLEEGFMRNIALMEHSGLIVADHNLKEDELDANGNPTGNKIKSNRLFLYSNVGLPSDVIQKLKEKYMPSKTVTGPALLAALLKAEALAICQYAWDIYLRGIISNEETERMYTGAPFFFKWKYGKVKNKTTGKVMNVLIDRHSDQSKRLGGLGSTGERNRLDLVDMKRTYKCAEIESKKTGSAIYNSLEEKFKADEIRSEYYEILKREILASDSENKQQLLDELNDKIFVEEMPLDKIKEDLIARDEKANSGISDEKENTHFYENIYYTAEAVGKANAEALSEGSFDVVDGAAYISPKMTANLLRMRGCYTDKVAEAFEYLSHSNGKTNILKDREAYNIIVNALIGAQKYSAYGYRMRGGTGEQVPVHYYDKYALFPLFKQIAYGFSAAVLDKMEKQGIDMVMMHSAVKTGSEEPSVCNPDTFTSAEEFEKFQFHTYDQDYAFVRRQLNTDPHKTEETGMGTQLTKIALSNLDPNKTYFKQDGTTVRGRDLLENIMTAINELSNIGYSELKQLLFVDGKDELDIDKFSIFLEEELENRDADENLLDAIQVDIVDGKKQLHVPLEAVSSVDWVQSILVAKINRDVIDINVDGNAFYQRSVWGMEGKPTILTQNKTKALLNNGNPLLMINEEGSMDAVISIDYFYNVIPEAIRYDFRKAKQWLIDHDFISGVKTGTTEWHNASAETIASRIPTQAQSSIHALRFVDVLPIVRSTIVLPQEFTGITGSDFDIDKLYMVSLSHRVKTTYKKSGDKNIAVDEVSTEYKVGSKNYYKNQLISGYLTLLKNHGKYIQQHDKDGKTVNGIIQGGGDMNISMRTVDSDTEPIKAVLERIEKDEPKQRYYAYQFGNLAFLVMTKAAFMVGKFGIGPFALNNNNQILTQLFGVRFADDGESIISQLGITRLDEAKDKQNRSKLSWLSGLINAHVDVAKDPYILRLNINTFTYNTTNLLIRGGMGERTFLFTAQPIMKELARVYDDASGSFMVDQSKSKSARLRTAIMDYVKDTFAKSKNGEISAAMIEKMMMGYLNSTSENHIVEMIVGSYAKALFGINDDGSYSNTFRRVSVDGEVDEVPGGCILEDVLTNKECRINVNNSATLDNMSDMPMYEIDVLQEDGTQKTVQISPRTVQLYVAYINKSLEKYGLKLSDLVNVCKIDTKKHGKNYIEQQAYLDKYNELFENEDEIFVQEGLDDLKTKSYIETKTNNATGLYREVLKGFSAQATDGFVKLHKNILQQLNSSPQDKILSSKVQRAIMKYFKVKFFDRYVFERSEELGYNYANNLFYGEDNMQNRLSRIQSAIKKNKNNEFDQYIQGNTITNSLLKSLIPDIYDENDEFNNPGFIKLENALLEDSEDINAIIRAWDQLFRDEEHYVLDSDGEKYTFRQFAIDLAVYAFYTSGDTTGKTKFFKYVPNTIRTYIGYSDYMRDVSDDIESLADDENTIKDIIKLNWRDDSFVRQYRSKIYGRANFVTFANVDRKINEKYWEKTKYGIDWKTAPKRKSIRILIGALRRSKSGPVVSVKENENGSYPPFIKLRRPSLDKYASDNVLLYEFAGTRPIDVTKPKLGVMPVYKLVLPNSTQIKAGTYWYDMINPVDADPIGYDINTVEKLDLYFDENGVVREDVSSKKELLDKFIETMDQSGIYLNEDEMIERIKTEFDNHDYAIKPTELEKAVNFALKKLKNKDSEQDKSKKSTSRKQTGTKEEKKPIESNGVTFTESTGGYAKRTEENAEWSDITLALAVDFTSRGELKTAEAAGAEVDRKEKTIKPGGKYMLIKLEEEDERLTLDYDMLDEIVEKAKKFKKPIKLNISGNGIYSFDSSSQEEINDILIEVLLYLSDNGIKIKEIRSGGQTGVDEAGIIAAKRLGIKASVHAPKGFEFRNADGVDITDRKAFEERFNVNQDQTENDVIEGAVEISEEDLAGILSGSVSETKSDKKKTSSTKKQQKSIAEISEEDLAGVLEIAGKKLKKSKNKVDFKRDETYKSLRTTSKTPFEVDGVSFSSVYQYYQYKRVDFSNENDKVKNKLRDDILNAQSYDEMRAISHEYQIDNDAWQKQVSSIIKQGLIYAYSDSRNAKAKKLLLSTGNAEISTGNDSTAKAYTEARERLRDFDDSDISEEAQNTCALKKKKK